MLPAVGLWSQRFKIMPAALPLPTRSAIVERRQQGMAFRQIATELQTPYASVRQVWHHWQQRGTLQPNSAACAHPGPRKPEAVYAAAVDLKRQHPRWGAVVIRLELLQRFAETEVPAVRTLQTWFRQAGVNRRRRPVSVQASVARGREVHDGWAVDAKEQMTLGDGSGASWLTITDETSGAILQATAFPPRPLDTGAAATGAADVATGLCRVGAAQTDAV